MATMNQLSTILTQFKESYSSIAGISTDSVTSPLTTASNTLSDAISGFSSAANDSVVTNIISGATLAKEGIERVKGHVEADISALLSNASQVMATIQLIEDLITSGESLRGRETVTETDENGNDVERVLENDQALIDKTNEKIDYYNEQGEKQLNAMADAINSVAFGVTGNMTIGGSLGASIGYSDNYSYQFETFVDNDPVGNDPGDDGDDPVVPGGNDPTPDPDPQPDPNGDNPEGDDEVEAASVPNLGEKVGDRFVEDWEDFTSDVEDRWKNVNGLLSGASAVADTVYEGVALLVDVSIDAAQATLDATLSASNWLLDGFNPRSGTTDEYWQNIGEDYSENWNTFGESKDFWTGAGNIIVGAGRTVVDAVQTVENAVVTAVDWVADNVLDPVVDFLGDAIGWFHSWLW